MKKLKKKMQPKEDFTIRCCVSIKHRFPYCTEHDSPFYKCAKVIQYEKENK